MTKDRVVPRKFGLVAGGLLSFGLFVAGGSALAQTPPPAQAPEEVTVTAPRVVHQTVGRSSTTGAPIEVTSISREVKFADINLSTPSGEAAVKERITQTARGMCKELDKMYPLEQRDPDCARKAIRDAMKQVDKARGYGTRE
jgi:UrcA family protein